MKNYDEFKKFSQEIEEKRNFTSSLSLLAIFFLIFLFWDKFWAWYEKPIKQEWDWDDEEEEETKNQKPVEIKLPDEKPIPKTKWERIKNLVLDNKVKTSCLLGIIGCLIALIWKIWVLYN